MLIQIRIQFLIRIRIQTLNPDFKYLNLPKIALKCLQNTEKYFNRYKFTSKKLVWNLLLNMCVKFRLYVKMHTEMSAIYVWYFKKMFLTYAGFGHRTVERHFFIDPE